MPMTVSRLGMFKGLSGTLAVWFLAVFAFVAFVGWHQLKDIAMIHEMAGEIEQSNHQSHHLHELEMRIRGMVAHAHDYLITGSDVYINRYRGSADGIDGMLSDAGLRAMDVEHIRLRLRAMHEIVGKIFALPFATGNMEGPILMQELDQELQRLSQAMSARHHDMDGAVNQSMRMVSGLHLDMREDFIASLFVLFGLLAGVAGYLYVRVARPLVLLRREVARIGTGDFSPDCPDFGENEIGDLSRALNSMGEALKQRSSELVQARSYAAHQEKMHALGLMTASIAHEVGNPLSAASVSLEVCRRKLARNDMAAVEKHLQATVSELQRTETIIRNVLDFGRRSSAGNEVMDIGDVVESALRLVRLSREAKSIEFRVFLPPGMPAAYGSEDVVRQVLVNLLLNAVDVSGPGDSIRISARWRQDCIFLDVTDQGGGVPEAISEQIFSPLFSTKPRGKGTGLGLSISRDLMRRMHGDLELLENTGRGCCFRISIPLGEGGADADSDH